jgi:hypothetical protein
MKNRGGYMLVELAAAIAAGSALTAVAVGVIYLLIDLERTSRDQFRQALAAASLSEEFRRDVRAATALDLPEKRDAPGQAGGGGRTEPDWQFRFPDRRLVEYRVADGELRRAEYDGEKLLRRESYRLPPGTEASIERSDVDGRTLVSLRIAPPRNASREPVSRPCRIDAVLAADRRFLPTEGP